MAIRYFCPSCWRQMRGEGIRCFHCGYDLSGEALLSYEEKLLRALTHPVRENRMMAIQVLGEMRCLKALPRFAAMLAQEQDIYIIIEIMEALHRIGNKESRDLILRLKSHPSKLVRNKAVRTVF